MPIGAKAQNDSTCREMNRNLCSDQLLNIYLDVFVMCNLTIWARLCSKSYRKSHTSVTLKTFAKVPIVYIYSLVHHNEVLCAASQATIFQPLYSDSADCSR